jgi:nucleoside-diphosphate-sugar epimerase
MPTDRFSEIRKDCFLAAAGQLGVYSKLGFQHIAVTGGTGFLGTWIAEMTAALNDEHRLGITLDVFSRNVNDWAQLYPHLAKRSDIRLRSQDVRSPFELARNTNFVVHAAGIPNNRVHASDPLRVQQTTLLGVNNTLDAATQLDSLSRFLINGVDGATYSIGSPTPVTHLELVMLLSDRVSPNARVVLNTVPSKLGSQDDLFPDTTHTQKSLGVTQTCSLEQVIDKTWRWFNSV